MVMAVINPDSTERFELRSIEGGFVTLKPMSYDTYLKRRDMTTQIRLAGGKASEFAGELAMLNQKVAAFEFGECIVDHNLEVNEGETLDFTKSSAIKRLAPKIGQEISDLISKMNELLDEDEEGN